MNNKKSKARMWIERAIENILDNWSAVGLLICVIIILLIPIVTPFLERIPSDTISNITSKSIYCALFSFIGLAIVFILLEIRFNLKETKSFSNYYDDMSSAQPFIFEELSKRMKMHRKEPVLLRVYGMRLSKVSTLLQYFIYSMKSNNLSRKLIVYIYHCNPDFLSNIKPENVDKKLQEHVINRFKIQIEQLLVSIKALKSASKDSLIELHFKKYSSLPSFWAYEIDKEEVFWGYFKWDEEKGDLIGPENQCCYFNKYNQPIKGFTDWIRNQFDGLEAWSIPDDSHTDITDLKSVPDNNFDTKTR